MPLQVVLITGSGSSFGLLTAETLASAGYTVYGGLHHVHKLGKTGANAGEPIRGIESDITKTSRLALLGPKS